MSGDWDDVAPTASELREQLDAARKELADFRTLTAGRFRVLHGALVGCRSADHILARKWAHDWLLELGQTP